MAEPIVRVSDLTYYYPGDEEPVLHDVNLEVYPGEFVLIIGPSGCGKSTLAHSLIGIIPLVYGGKIKGRVYIDGTETRSSTVYELGTKIGMVFQDPDTQFCSLYVRDEVAFGPANLMLPREEIFKRIDRSLTDVGELDIGHKLIYEISGGQKQRVAVASILAMKPKVIIMDEPTANLDPLGAVKIFDLLKQLNREQGLTVIIIEHNVDSVMCHADRMILMDRGTIRFCAPPRQAMKEMGRFILNDMGLRIPQVSELGLRLADKGLHLNPFPLTLQEAVESLDKEVGRLKILPAELPQPDTCPHEPVIKTEHLSFSYSDGTKAVKDVSLEIDKGDVVGIIGKNGSGKTTLTSLFIGLNKPKSGRGVICGLDIAKSTTQELAAKVGYVFQYPENQFVTDVVSDEVAYSLKAQKRPPEEVETRVNQTLELLGLEKLKDKHPFRLSMGQKRRLSVATMLILNTEILILDEPTTGQDKKNIDNIMKIMMDVNRKGTTILLITHDMNLVASYCNKVLVMDAGEMVFLGSKVEFCKGFATIRSNALVLPEMYQLGQALAERGITEGANIFTVQDLAERVEVD
jgi:energy-coupling factor transporter ATP-binding protein EcfA2